MKSTCASSTTKRGGRPRLNPELERHGFTHGWMMAVDGESNKILGLDCMHKPENNATAIKMLLRLARLMPKLKTLVYDRACSLKKQASRQPGLKGLKHYVVDKFHGHRHSKKCVANPHVHKHLAKAIAKANTSACEQTFAWMRRYA